MTAALARCGGDPVQTMEEIRSGLGKWPDVREEDIDAVVGVLRSDAEPWGFLHPTVREFQNAYAAHTGRAFCLAVNTGTAALQVAVAAAGVSAGDEVITAALGFVASATCILHQNAIPVFADVDPHTFNLDPDDVVRRITPRTKAIIAVDLLGLPAAYDRLMKIANAHNLVLIEDASQSQGGSFHGIAAGGLGHISAMSIMASKNLPSAGEGGVVTTNDADCWQRILGMASHGMNPWENEAGGPRRIALQLGFNLRPTPTSVAFATGQLRRLPEYQSARQERIDVFETELKGAGNDAARVCDAPPGGAPMFLLPHVPDATVHAWQMYRLMVDPAALGLSDDRAECMRDAVMFLARAEGALCGFWEEQTLPSMKLFQEKIGYGGGCPWSCFGANVDYDEHFAISERIISRGIILPMTRATNSLSMVQGQGQMWAKIASAPDVVVALTERIFAAGGFAQWSGVDIRDFKAQVSLRYDHHTGDLHHVG